MTRAAIIVTSGKSLKSSKRFCYSVCSYKETIWKSKYLTLFTSNLRLSDNQRKHK